MSEFLADVANYGQIRAFVVRVVSVDVVNLWWSRLVSANATGTVGLKQDKVEQVLGIVAHGFRVIIRHVFNFPICFRYPRLATFLEP